MKTVAVVSDTHGKLSPAAYMACAGADLIIHAGDICDPAILRELETLAPVRAVLGNNDYDEYGPHVGRFANFEYEGVRFLVAHYPWHVRAERLGTPALAPGDPIPDVSIHGHTHIPELVAGVDARPARIMVCPGSVSRPRGGYPASIAVLEVEDGCILGVRVEDLQGNALLTL